MLDLTKLKKENKLAFLGKMASAWIALNMTIILLFAYIYKVIDSKTGEKKSMFRGITHKDKFGEYIYFSVIITTTLGLGEIVPDPDAIEKSWPARFAVATHILSTLWFNDILDSIENIKLS